MRIAYVCADPGVPVFGWKGCSVHVQEVVRALTAEGAEVELFARRIGGNPAPGLSALRVHQLSKAPGGDQRTREQTLLATDPELRTALEHAGPFDLVYERHSLWSCAAMEYARDRNVPGLLEVNAPLLEEQARHRGLVDCAGAELAARRSFAAATALLAVSEGVADYLRTIPGAGSRIHVVPNGVDAERFRTGLPAASPTPPGTITIGFVGTLKPWHGLPDLIDAFTELRARCGAPLRLLIVGDGPEREALCRRLELNGIRNAALLPGAVEPAVMPRWLASMDVAVAPYPEARDCYFSPLKVYEYMAAGLPVVASRTGQLTSLIRDGVTGLLYPAGDVAGMTHALQRLRSDPAARLRLGYAARRVIEDAHTWHAVAQRILQLADASRREHTTSGHA